MNAVAAQEKNNFSQTYFQVTWRSRFDEDNPADYSSENDGWEMGLEASGLERRTGE